MKAVHFSDAPAPSTWTSKLTPTPKGPTARPAFMKTASISTSEGRPLPLMRLFKASDSARSATEFCAKEGCLLPWGVEEREDQTTAQKGTGKAPPTQPGKKYHAAVKISDATATRFFKEVDAWVRAQAVKDGREWFGRAITEAEAAAMQSPILKEPEGYLPHVNVKFIPDSGAAKVTKITWNSEGDEVENAKVEEVVGHRQLQGLIVLEVSSVWMLKTNYGVTLKAAQAYLCNASNDRDLVDLSTFFKAGGNASDRTDRSRSPRGAKDATP